MPVLKFHIPSIPVRRLHAFWRMNTLQSRLNPFQTVRCAYLKPGDDRILNHQHDSQNGNER
jgi:hypothetical protein